MDAQALKRRLLQAAVARYRTSGRFAYHFARGKLDRDPVFAAILAMGLIPGQARILDLAAACGVESSLHNPVGPIQDLVSLQVAAALPAFLILERQVRESPLFDQICGGPMPLVDGRLALPGDAGIGASPDRATLERLAVTQVRRSASFAGMQGAGPNA